MSGFRVTIVDIAEDVGVHPSTVSLALRNSPKISPATTEKVKEAAARLGYRADPFISALMSAQRQRRRPKEPPAIAMITAFRERDGWSGEEHLREFHAGCSKALEDRGISLRHFWLGDPETTAVRLEETLDRQGIRGALFLPIGTHREKLNHRWQKLAAVSYGITAVAPEVDCVRADHYGNVEAVLAELTRRGHQRIGFAMDAPYLYDNHNRWLAAYALHARQSPGEARLEPYLEAQPTPDSFSRWRREQRPDVIVCINGEQVCRWLKAEGVSVPGDVGVASVACPAGDSVVSGVSENARSCGGLAASMLLDRMHHNDFGPPQIPRCFSVRGVWKERATLREPAGALSQAATG